MADSRVLGVGGPGAAGWGRRFNADGMRCVFVADEKEDGNFFLVNVS
jgi:hypothetical protein